ncbi:phage tail sheath C-terminal domain-containing protein [Burkholderia sp. SRS-W-2-2016]|uniref:phage tail sheath family protein n=1 Tax=Burkholderia sp. SRS-W-2-2016 TaxID=1926878 RepID=UPI0015BAB0B1|nr:phage tail sheath C-terminal domain-containing protein [Burkholderia sp. SRS-W-2-2016]
MASTSIALFVGPTKTGIDGRPIRVRDIFEFQRAFGPLIPTSSLSYSVAHFFDNGGKEAFVKRVKVSNAGCAESTLKKDDGSNADSFTFTALSSGGSGNELFVEIDSFGIGAKPYDAAADQKRFNVTITDRTTGRVERFGDLSTDTSASRYLANVLDDIDTGSKLVGVSVAGTDAAGPQASGTIYKIGKAFTPGKFAADVLVQLSVAMPKDDGSYDAKPVIDNLAVTVFEKDDVQPTSALEFANRLARALNSAIREDTNAAKAMQNVAIEIAPYTEPIDSAHSNVYLRLRTSPPTATNLQRRVSEATVTLSDPSAGKKLLGTYSLAPQIVNPSRYRLGMPYKGSQVSAATPGADGDVSGQPADDEFKSAVTELDDGDPFFNILCLPDLVRSLASDPRALQHSNAMTVYAEAARVCENKLAFLLVDPFPDVQTAGEAEAWKSLKFTFQSNHAAAYFPKIRVDDPLLPGMIISHPPSGAIAGVFARTDAQTGPWQAPAGTEAVLTGVYGTSVPVSDADQGSLNPIGLNCIRQFPIYQTVSFGSRTIDGADAQGSEWKYIPVRRIALLILKSLSDSLRWAVHRPNGEQLWAELRMNVTAFMQMLFRQGAFKGTSARDAYFVRCDATTTTSEDINAGVVNIIVGFAPLRPAEFVVVSLQQMVQPATA